MQTNDNLTAKKILVTGATGFIGSFIVEEALKRGMDVWAAVRPTSSRKYLPDPRTNFIELDLADPARLRQQLGGHRFDYVVHAAGATKCIDKGDFRRTNTLGTQHLADALTALGMPLRRFVFVSSLSVMGPVREREPHTDIAATDEPRPDTAYGQSKLEAERYLDSLDGFPAVTLRPTGVYGPRERDYFMMVESIKKHTDFAAGLRPQSLTFVYVKDVVEAVFLAIERGRTGAKYFLSDGCVYSSRTFSDLIIRELGNPWVARVKAPLWLLRTITACGEQIGRLTGRPIALNNDKYRIMRQRNWRCDIAPARAELGFNPQWQLERGVRETVKWYKDNGWI